MTDPRIIAREVLAAAGFHEIGSHNGGATGSKQRFASINANLYIMDGAEAWTAEIAHNGAVLGKGADHDPYTALQAAIKAATRRTTSILDILKG